MDERPVIDDSDEVHHASELVVAAEMPTRAHADQAAARLIGESVWATVHEPADSTDRGGEAWSQVLVQRGDLFTAQVILDLIHDVDLGRDRPPRSWWSSHWYARVAAIALLIALVVPALVLVLLALSVVEPML